MNNSREIEIYQKKENVEDMNLVSYENAFDAWCKIDAIEKQEQKINGMQASNLTEAKFKKDELENLSKKKKSLLKDIGVEKVEDLEFLFGEEENRKNEAGVNIKSKLSAPTEQIFKREALVATYESIWPTICRDLKDASKNGLAKAAKSGPRGWIVERTLDWAKARNKIISSEIRKDPLTQAMNNFSRTIHRVSD